MASRITTTVVAIADTVGELDNTTAYLQANLANGETWTVTKDIPNLKVTATHTAEAVNLGWMETPA